TVGGAEGIRNDGLFWDTMLRKHDFQLDKRDRQFESPPLQQRVSANCRSRFCLEALPFWSRCDRALPEFARVNAGDFTFSISSPCFRKVQFDYKPTPERPRRISPTKEFAVVMRQVVLRDLFECTSACQACAPQRHQYPSNLAQVTCATLRRSY